MKFKVFLQQYVEEVAEVEIEADSVEAAIAEAEDMAREGYVDWSDGGDVIVGAAAEVGRPAYCVKDTDDNEVWERG
jgi:hypothetical protein